MEDNRAILDAEMKELLQSACPPVVAPLEYKVWLLAQLKSMVGAQKQASLATASRKPVLAFSK